MTRLRHALVLGVAAALLLGAGASTAIERWLLPRPDGDVLTILLLGSDEGPPRSSDPLRGRADGFQLLFVSANRLHATFVSIPRDAYVNVPGHGATRINTCLVSGPERCVETVESVFGIDVDHYLLTSMRGFMRGVERNGGVEVEVPTRLRVGSTSVPAGRARLDGAEALAYVRDRTNRGGGDFARSQAQAEVLAQLHRELVADPSPGRVFQALRDLRRHTVTDLSGPQLTRLAFEALRVRPDNVKRAFATGSLATVGGASVVRLHDSAYRLIRDAAEDGRI